MEEWLGSPHSHDLWLRSILDLAPGRRPGSTLCPDSLAWASPGPHPRALLDPPPGSGTPLGPNTNSEKVRGGPAKGGHRPSPPSCDLTARWPPGRSDRQIHVACLGVMELILDGPRPVRAVREGDDRGADRRQDARDPETGQVDRRGSLGEKRWAAEGRRQQHDGQESRGRDSHAQPPPERPGMVIQNQDLPTPQDPEAQRDRTRNLPRQPRGGCRERDHERDQRRWVAASPMLSLLSRLTQSPAGPQTSPNCVNHFARLSPHRGRVGELSSTLDRDSPALPGQHAPGSPRNPHPSPRPQPPHPSTLATPNAKRPPGCSPAALVTRALVLVWNGSPFRR